MIATAIWADLLDRRGLKWEAQKVDDDVVTDDILPKWAEIIAAGMKPPPERRLLSDAALSARVAELERALEQTLSVRECVRWFALQMEAKLRKHDAERGVRGWANDHASALRDRIDDKLDELCRVIGLAGGKLEISEAVDVANFAMMVADNARTALSRADGEK